MEFSHNSRQRVIRLAMFLVFTAVCCFPQSQSNARSQLALIVAPSSSNVSYATQAGQTELTYTLEEPYPAERTIRFIEETLRSRKLKQVESGLSAKAGSSRERGWTSYENATCLATRTIHQWVGEWQDNEHNLVRYTLRYVKKGADSQDENAPALLQVSAIYMPASVVRSITHLKSH